MSKPYHQVYSVLDFEVYTPFFNSDWTDQLDKVTEGTKLEDAARAFIVTTKALSNSFGMPWVLMKSLENQWESLVQNHSYFMAVDLIAANLFGRIEQRVGGLRREALRQIRSITEEIKNESATAANSLSQQFPFDELWSAQCADGNFMLAIAATQQACFAGLYYGYENFVRELLAVVRGEPEYRIGKQTLSDLTAVVGQSTADKCLRTNVITVTRLLRNSLAHNGGRVQPELAAYIKRHYTDKGADFPFVIVEGVIQISPEQTAKAYNFLSARVHLLASEVLVFP